MTQLTLVIRFPDMGLALETAKFFDSEAKKGVFDVVESKVEELEEAHETD